MPCYTMRANCKNIGLRSHDVAPRKTPRLNLRVSQNAVATPYNYRDE